MTKSPCFLRIATIALAVGCTSVAFATGGGAGAGGASAQRGINSGLPPGEAGPAGAANNRPAQLKPPSGLKGSPRSEPGQTR